MKRCLFIYREDRHSLCDPSYGYVNHLVVEEMKFPTSATDEEILRAARRHEVKDRLEDRNTASEGILNRILERVVQIAREVPI